MFITRIFLQDAYILNIYTTCEFCAAERTIANDIVTFNILLIRYNIFVFKSECTSIDPCGVNQICKNDNECQNEHKCGTDNCPSFLGLESSSDCCQKPNVIFSFYQTKK